VRFSSRTPADLGSNEVAAAADAARASGRPLIDLTISNPTIVDLPGAALVRERVARALARGALATYQPDPRGLLGAREAVAAHHAARGLTVDPDDVFLTCSTSEAYGWLFKLCCDPGDLVLIPSPSYPLFEHLAALDGVATATYDDPRHVRPSPRARAVIAVSPDNPTGAVLDDAAVASLDQACARAGCALIGDEVFAEYVTPGVAVTSVLAAREALTFSLGGLSKSAGLPQLKVGWIVVGGPAEVRALAKARLDVIADAYLSVATPVQVVLPELLAIGADVRDAIRERVAATAGALDEFGVPTLARGGGWTAIVPLPEGREDAAVAELLADGVIVQPGWFFDLAGDHVIVSLLTPPDDLARALPALVAAIASRG